MGLGDTFDGLIRAEVLAMIDTVNLTIRCYGGDYFPGHLIFHALLQLHRAPTSPST
jgi:hypothetical protein